MEFLKRVILLGLIMLALIMKGQSQNCTSARYLERIFNDVTVTPDIIYGNAPSVTDPYIAENVTIDMDLKLDLFEPTGDTLIKRPLVILAFGGGFLIGSKDDEDIQATCDSLARIGYVAASINYRIGMNIAIASSAERAVYRGIQDYSAAVRYFKEFAATYRIDTNYIFIGGVSAGAISALQLAFSEESNRPASTFSSGLPDPAPDLGSRDSSGNLYNHSSTNVKAIINCWGAMGDVSWIEPGEDVPIISFHGDQDAVVPYDSGYPFTVMATMPYVYGSLPISQRADSIGLYNELYPFAGEGHNLWGTVVNNQFVGGPTVYFEPILHSISDFLFLFIKPATEPITGDTTVCFNDTSTYSVPNTTGSSYCWNVSGGAVISADSTKNTIQIWWNTIGQHNISVTEINVFQARGDIQSYTINAKPLPGVTIQEQNNTLIADQGFAYEWYLNGTLLPGETAYLVSTLQSGSYVVIITDSNGCKAASAPYSYMLVDIEPKHPHNLIKLYPNPNDGIFYIQGTGYEGHSISSLKVFNVLGETVYQQEITEEDNSTPHYKVDISALPGGVYLVKLSSVSGNVHRKIITH